MTEERVAGHVSRRRAALAWSMRDVSARESRAQPRSHAADMVRWGHRRERIQPPVLASELMACLLGAVDVSAGVQRPVLVRRPKLMRLGRANHAGDAAWQEAAQLRQMPSGAGEHHPATLAARRRITPPVIDGRQ
jgi:hypothetical protein